MKREDFTKVVEETVDSLPKEFRRRIRNVAVLVEDSASRLHILNAWPATAHRPRAVPWRADDQEELLSRTIGSPDYVVLYQENIEAICATEAEVREQNPADGHT